MFAIEPIKEVSIVTNVYRLLVNGKKPIDEFIQKYKNDPQYKIQIGQIQSILMFIGKNEESKIPTSKFKALRKNKKDKYIDYEIKTKDLRVYLFLDKAKGKIVTLGGLKKTQKKDMNKMRNWKKAYFEQ